MLRFNADQTPRCPNCNGTKQITLGKRTLILNKNKEDRVFVKCACGNKFSYFKVIKENVPTEVKEKNKEEVKPIVIPDVPKEEEKIEEIKEVIDFESLKEVTEEVVEEKPKKKGGRPKKKKVEEVSNDSDEII